VGHRNTEWSLTLTNPHNEPSFAQSRRLLLTEDPVTSSFSLGDRAWSAFTRQLDEDGDEDQDNNEDEDQQQEEDQQEENEQEDEQEGENEEEEEEENEQQQDENEDQQQNRAYGDDFFDDFIQDDLVMDDDSTKYMDDDFYLFEKRMPRPSVLPLTGRTVVGFFIAALATSLGSTGGVGGGGAVVPIYILVLGLPIQVAIPIGAVTVLGGALASTSLNWWRRHPLADRPLIDWDLLLVMEPLTLVGTLLGTLFHRVLSEKLLVVLLVLLLSVTAHTTLSKAMRMYKAERRYIRAHLKAARTRSEPPIGSPASFDVPKLNTWGSVDPTESDSLAVSPDTPIGSPGHNVTFDRPNSPMGHPEIPRQKRDREIHHHLMDQEEKEQILILNPDFVTLRSELIEQEKYTPRSKIIALCCMFSLLTFLNIMVGGGAYKSPWDIVCGSASFWTVHAIMIAFLIASAWAAQTYVVARHEIKELVRFDYVHGDIKWDARSSIIYPAVFVSAGIFAGTLGIGGGGTFLIVSFSWNCGEANLLAHYFLGCFFK
jgi:uncharacterized membrane protein YfcA